MSDYDQLLSLPDVNFTEIDAEIIEKQIIAEYQTAAKTVLYPGDPIRLFLSTLAYRIAQERAITNNAGRQTLLRYATGNKLDHIGAMSGVTRLGQSYSQTTFLFSVQQLFNFDVIVPIGTRVTADGQYYFATDKELMISAGRLSGSVTGTCLASGSEYNNIEIGQLNKLVDPVAYVIGVANTSISTGGADIENDESYRERIALAPESFSTAGPKLAYKYHALSAHQNISSVAVERPEPGVVKVSILLSGGIIPGENSSEINAVINTLNDEKIRPLTDTVDVFPAEGVSKDYTVKWFISQSVTSLQSTIQEKIISAISEYEVWQQAEIGRDINPDELIALCKKAGAKRVEIDGISFQVLDDNQVCQFITNSNRIVFGGTEKE